MSASRPEPGRVAGALLGTAVGDALGLPYEGLSARRAARLFGAPDRFRFLAGRGMVSDDTEQSALLLDALVVSGGDAARLTRAFGWRLRWWLLGLPAGTGMATVKAIVRLWLGWPAERAGVRSAGNGAAMRAAVLGALATDPVTLEGWVVATTRVTHRDERAFHGALVVALVAHLGAGTGRVDAAGIRAALSRCETLADSRMMGLVDQALHSVESGETTEAFAAACGLERGVTGFVEHTVPVAVHAVAAHPGRFADAVHAVIRCGGDADTTAAIVGGMAGAAVGEEGIDAALLGGILDWPMSVANLRRLAQVACGSPASRPALHLPLRLPRNAVFLAVVLLHGLRRVLPPY